MIHRNMSHRKLTIREATVADWPAAWLLFRDVSADGDVFAHDETTDEETAYKLWYDPPGAMSFVAEIDGRIVGAYYVRPNQPGRGNHIATAQYMVTAYARGKGVGSALCGHSLDSAWRLGFSGLQVNFVVSTNAAAVRVGEKHGFSTICRLPAAFRHKELGLVDVLVLFRMLTVPERIPE